MEKQSLLLSSTSSLRNNVPKLNKSFLSKSRIAHTSVQEKSKCIIVKKIVMISSVKPQIKKNILKYLEGGSKILNNEIRAKIVNYSKSILDNDKQKQLNEDLEILSSQTTNPKSLILKIVKQLVITPLEKSYITKIEKEIKEQEDIEAEMKYFQKEIENQKLKKLQIHTGQKSRAFCSTSKNMENTERQVQNFQNKLMRANQKLNQLSSNNNKLRQKINQLRKQKNAMQNIYHKLKKELQQKKQNVQSTIKYAGQAYKFRNKAEDDLKNLKEQSDGRKEQFKVQCQKLSNQIDHNVRFKQFIKSKQIQKEHLETLEEQIHEKQKQIQQRKEENNRIDQEYQKCLDKEKQIKNAFSKIKKQIRFKEINNENQGKQLLQIFISLYEKNNIMKKFVIEIDREVEDLQSKIKVKKEQIQKIYLKGTSDQCDKQKLNQDLKKRFYYQETKKKILDEHFQKSVDILSFVKIKLEEVFQEIGMDEQVIEKLKNCNLNEQNLSQFLGQLEKKAIETISDYGRSLGQDLQLASKQSSKENQKEIDQLTNIIVIENISTMNNSSSNFKNTQFPSELIIKTKEDKVKQEEHQKPLSTLELQKYAIQTLETYQKKQYPMKDKIAKKYNLAPMMKSKKKQ